MEEKWKRFFYRTAVSCLGAVYSYVSATSYEDLVVKALVVVVMQALLASLATAPGLAAQKKQPTWKRYLSRI